MLQLCVGEHERGKAILKIAFEHILVRKYSF